PAVVTVPQPRDVLMRLEGHLAVNERGPCVDGADKTIRQQDYGQHSQRNRRRTASSSAAPLLLLWVALRASRDCAVGGPPADRAMTRAQANQPFDDQQRSENVAGDIQRPNRPALRGAKGPGREKDSKVKAALGDPVADSIGFRGARVGPTPVSRPRP